MSEARPGGGSSRAVEFWLYAVLTLVAAMVALGGLTRLTGSGLSIVRWDLVSGILPPFSEAGWEEAFRLYRQIPEYREQNAWMELGDFRRIFWWEWSHRLLGRVVGAAYAVPLLFFALRGRIPDFKNARQPASAGCFVFGCRRPRNNRL